MTGRNAPCPCGSGKKYKRCHGKVPQSAAAPGPMNESARLARQALSAARKGEPGAHENAEQLLQKWADGDPDDPRPLHFLIELALNRKNLAGASDGVARLLQAAPSAALSEYYHAVVLQLQGLLPGAFAAYEKAVSRQVAEPLDSSALRVEAAIEMLETAGGQYPGAANRDQAQLVDHPREMELLADALSTWEQSGPVARAPAARVLRYADAWYNLGCAALVDFHRLEHGIDCFARAVHLDPDHELARSNGLFILNYSPRHGAAELALRHLAEGSKRAQGQVEVRQPFPNERSSGRKLRIAYLSSDFRDHSVAHFILPVLEAHDRDRFDITLYYNNATADSFTRRAAEQVNRFRQVVAMSDDELMRQIAADRIDLLVELNGLSKGHRLGLLARRAAPVQISWLGYPNTTGLETMDYRIVDRTVAPAEEDSRSSEKLLRLPGVFSVYRPPADCPLPGGPAARRKGHLTLGSFNHLPKITPEMLDLWAEILRRLPDSRLLIKSVMLDYRRPGERLLRALTERGIASGRVSIAGRSSDKAAHMAHYREIDLSLDTYPYNGTTTTCDSLYMGVPVVTRAGDDHRSRVGASFLGAMGLDFLVARNDNAYVEASISLASDISDLEALHDGLRGQLLGSALMDAATLTSGLETAFMGAWKTWCEKPGAGEAFGGLRP